MKRTLPIFLLCQTLAFAVQSESAMTGAEFDAYTTGKTLTYSQGGAQFGIEQYLAGRKVRWAFTNEECREGFWYEEAGQICFVYEDPDDPQCWSFFRGADGLKARFMNDPAGTELSEVQQSKAPMSCAGPDVGV